MSESSKFLIKVKQTDPDQQRAYALGAFEVMQYLYDISTRGEDVDFKRLIYDEYRRTRKCLYDAIMVEKAGNGPVSEEGERDG